MVNEREEPFGELWTEVKKWMYDIGVRCFPWESTWEEQTNTDLNTFWKRICAQCPGHWKDSSIESQVV